MGRRSSITEETGQDLLEAYGRLGDKRAAAAEVGVSSHAAYRFFATIGENTTPIVATQQQIIANAGASLWDTRAALDENYTRCLQLLERLQNGIVEQHGEFVSLTPMATHVSALREVRAHIESGMTLQKLLIDVDQVRIFQQAVIEAIGEADEPTQQRLIAKLRRKRALGLALPGAAAN